MTSQETELVSPPQPRVIDLTGAQADPPEDAPRRRLVTLTPWLLALACFVPYTALAVDRYLRFLTMSYDLSIFEQAIKAYAHVKAPIVDIKGPGFNLLGDHFHPLLVVFAPFYRVFPSPITLLVLQSALFALSVVPVTRLAISRFGLSGGACFGAAYGLAWGVQSAVDFDFHEICLAVPILAFALEAYVRERYVPAALWAVALLGVKEDLGLTVAVFGFCLLLRRRWTVGAATTVAGILGFLLVIRVIVPHFNPDGVYPYLDLVNGGGDGGESGRGMLGTLLHLPVDLVRPRVKAWTMVLTLGVTAFAALRSPLTLLVLPTFAWRFTADNENYWGTGWHYNAIPMVIIFFATLDAIPGLRRARWRPLRGFALHLPAVALAIAVTLTPQFPMRWLVDPAFWRPTDTQQDAVDALAAVPDGVVVEADVGMMAPLVHRTHVYGTGDTGDVVPDYIAFDSDWGDVTPAEAEGHVEDLHPDQTYEIVFARGRYTVLRHTG